MSAMMPVMSVGKSIPLRGLLNSAMALLGESFWGRA
eukprot:CAMPEP_0202388498 /NCGR_PEP_ID=MMETSP1127-20130417/77905_1 /ASSEMBLY_ACC=CAM_ASM_000462 /TAXON_ID=3047 /ORGANISM="Dunaliella tertiolecta, Strain CCMP1320" /LENGTH=35 /DNA_ID= /DNA_START= /DNA_END= /DNA_ORIENTATION=